MHESLNIFERHMKLYIFQNITYAVLSAVLLKYIFCYATLNKK